MTDSKKKTSSITLNKVNEFIDKQVEISGWLYNKRSSGKIIFLQVRDGTGFIQATVIKGNVSDDLFNQLEHLTLESSLTVIGKLKKDDRSPTGFELEVFDVQIISKADDGYPIGKKKHGVDFLLDHRHLWLRSKRQRAIQLIRDEVIRAVYDFYKQQDFVKIDTPIFTPNACEGTTTLFEVDYFGGKSYLSQSGQLYLEAAIFSLRRVFDFAPVFRAEKSKTRRHLVEFWMTNAEAAFVNHEDNLKIQEEMISFIVAKVLSNKQEELRVLKRDIRPLEKIKPPFPRMTYKQAVLKLQKMNSNIKDGDDLGAPDEAKLSMESDKPLFIQFYPAKIKAFYMKRHPQDKEYVLGADLLAPEGYGEIIGGSERETDWKTLKQSLEDHNLFLKDFSWYLDLRRFGSVPHSGFGLGLERIIAWICGLKHVRETIPFPRMIYRNYP